ncbi:sensor histidine kinase [Microbacterium sp. NPDC091313]
MSSDERPRFRLPPLVTLLVPVVVAFLVQVPATAVIALHRHPRLAALSIGLAAAAALALLGLRRWPGPTVAVVGALSLAALFVPPDAGPPFVALAFAIVGAVVRGARMWALVSVATAWTAAMIGAGLADVSWPPLRVALTTVGLIACFAIGEGARARFAAAAERREQLEARRVRAEQEERTRIARELHDVLAHSLSQIAVQSGVGLHLFERDPQQARAALAAIRTLSATGLEEVRGVLGFLRGDESSASAPLTPQPQLDDLPALAAARSGLGLDVAFDDRTDGARPGGAVQSAAYRIVQEALTNVVRHSAAAHARVEVAREGGDLVLRVVDDGTGVDPAAVDGGGTRGMRERAEAVGGAWRIARGDAGGTVVTARLPWDGAA